jgi:hypothetical protein
MGMSGFKLFLILAVVGILFLPTMIRRSSGFPALFKHLQARIAGEQPERDDGAPLAEDAVSPDSKPTRAERFGNMIAQLKNNILSRVRRDER